MFQISAISKHESKLYTGYEISGFYGIIVFWDVVLHNYEYVDVYHHFRGIWCFHLQVGMEEVKIKAVCCHKTLLAFY
jgi:hypothetical protein